MNAKLSKGALIYVSPEFPKQRHGFEAEELTLLSLSREVTIISLRKPTSGSMAWLRSGYPRLAGVRLEHLTPTGVTRGLLWALMKSPVGVARFGVLVAKVASRDPRGGFKTLVAGLGGFAIARRAAASGISWIHADFASAPATAALAATMVSSARFSFCGHAFDIFSTKPAGRATPFLLGVKLRQAQVAFAENSKVVEVLNRIAVDVGLSSNVVLKRNGISIRPARTESSRSDVSRVIGLGALDPKKGFDTLIRAGGILSRRGVKVVLEIHGEGPERLMLQQLARDQGVHIVMPGSFDRPGLQRILDSASVVVMPSRRLANGDSDGVPTVLIESLSVGVPVIATNVGAISDLVEDGITGFVVPSEDANRLAAAIETMLSNPSHAEDLANRGRDRVLAEFSVERSVATLLSHIPNDSCEVEPS